MSATMCGCISVAGLVQEAFSQLEQPAPGKEAKVMIHCGCKQAVLPSVRPALRFLFSSPSHQLHSNDKILLHRPISLFSPPPSWYLLSEYTDADVVFAETRRVGRVIRYLERRKRRFQRMALFLVVDRARWL
ncbi:uncharacterized [Tachysurus ichikawai]